MISETDLMWWCCLHHQCKSLTEIKSVCDLGLQELKCVDSDTYDRTTKTFAELCGEPDVSLAGCRSSAEMWRRLRREIVSLDVVGHDVSLMRFDLNRDRVPLTLREHFDFVTNVGTTEHVFNQANCIEVVHDLTRVGGIMAHAVPFQGYENHGFFKYTQKFFTRIAKVNDYECLDAWISMDLDARTFKPDVAEFFVDHVGIFRNARSSDHPIDFYNLKFHDYRSADACIYVFLRKTKSMQFQIPLDVPDEAEPEWNTEQTPRAKAESERDAERMLRAKAEAERKVEQVLRAQAEAERDAIRQSTFWRLTAPLRATINFFKKR